MIRKSLLCAVLLSLAQGSQAQGSNCGLAISKSGTGLARNYTLTVPPNVPTYLFNIYLNGWQSPQGATISGTGLTKSVTYTYGGVYSIGLESPNYCTDSIGIQDTVQGPMNCNGVSTYLNASVNAANQTVFLTHSAYGNTAPGYTTSVVYNYGDGTSGTSPSHTYSSPGYVTATAVATFTHPQYGSCTATSTRSFLVPIASCNATISKSGTGLTRSYTTQSNAPNTQTQFAISSYNWWSAPIATGSGSPFSYTYAQPGRYLIEASVNGATCQDSVFFIDTVAGPLNCAALTHTLSITGGYGASRQFNVTGTVKDYYPGYSSSTLYSYGDGTSGTSGNHTYTATGTYVVTATTTRTHPTYGTCTIVDTLTVPVAHLTFDCTQAHAGFNYSNSGNTYNFTSTTAYPAVFGVAAHYSWRIDGYGYFSNSNTSSYTFPQSGTYNVWLSVYWTGDGAFLCQDSVMHTITVSGGPTPNVITASANWDSSTNAAGASVKMWLIQYDSSTQSLSAVDSALIPVQANVPYAVHDFAGKPAGQYRVKAHMINQPTSWTTGFLPTYSYNAAYWANAAVINHTGATVYANTWLQQGTPMTGPGFISGSVLQGANKGAAVGDPMGNITILLRNNANNQLVASTETDANGTYTFTNVPVGSYNVYPEELNYATTPSAPIQITATGFPSTANDFWRETVAKTLHPITPSSVKAVAEEGQILVSPNPAKDLLSIQFATAPQKGSTVQLYNLSGQLVKAFPITDAQTTQQLSLSGVAAGQYLLYIPTSQGRQVSRITIQP